MVGEWVSSKSNHIRLRIKRSGANFTVQYYYPGYVIDTIYNADYALVIETLSAPGEGEILSGKYDKEKDRLGLNTPVVYYDEKDDALGVMTGGGIVARFNRIR